MYKKYNACLRLTGFEVITGYKPKGEGALMRKIVKGVQFICSGIIEIFVSILRCIVSAVNKLIRKYRRWRLRKATAYVNRYGIELELNSRVKVAGKAYYVLSYERFEDIEDRREVRVNLIGVPQYREIKRRITEK